MRNLIESATDWKWPDKCAWPLMVFAVLYFGGHLIYAIIN